MDATEYTQRLVRLRLHLLSLASHLSTQAQPDYEVCTQLVDETLLALRHNGQSPRGIKSLTTRENQVLLLLREGCSNQRIAQQLGVSAGTVKTYLKSIFNKLGVHNRTQAALTAGDTSYSTSSPISPN